jgi:flagellar biosynthesis protein FlhF
MRIRRFVGANVSEALRQVREAMGEEALVLARRDLGAGRVEITAAVDVDLVSAPVTPARAEEPGAPSPGGGASLGARRVDRLVDEIRSLGASLHWIEERLGTRAPGGAPCRDGGGLLARLTGRGLAPHLATPIASRAHQGLAAGRSLAAAVEEGLGAHLRFAGDAGAARVMAFVGPTGSGKTTTIAKLAATAVQSGRRPPGLVMADAQRVGAGEQLACYARLLGAPIRTVNAPEEIPAALRELADADRILVDTGGVSGDGESAAALARVIGALPGEATIAAVFSATTSRSALDAGWRRIERLAPGCCVVTKIDECEDPGTACGWAADVGLPLAWLGTGPRVPQDFCAADGASLARCLLGA